MFLFSFSHPSLVFPLNLVGDNTTHCPPKLETRESSFTSFLLTFLSASAKALALGVGILLNKSFSFSLFLLPMLKSELQMFFYFFGFHNSYNTYEKFCNPEHYQTFL